MKRLSYRVAVLILVVALVLPAASALAESDLVVKKATVYSDAALTKASYTVPAWTSVVVLSHKSDSVYKISYKDRKGYVRTSDLTPETLTYTGGKILPKGTRVYQRPTTSSASAKAPKTLNVLIIGRKGSWTLARTDDPDYDAIYFFVKSKKLS